MPDRESLSPAMAKLADEIVSGGIDAGKVLRLRQEVFRDGVTDRDEANFLFYLNEQAGPSNDDAWYYFFVEALSGYFVHKQEIPGYLGDDDANFLVEQITHDGKIDRRTEFGLLLNIMNRMRTCPENVIVLALEGVKETVLGGGDGLFGPEERRPGVIDPADVELIRAVIFSGGGDGSLTITKREAELVFDLNNRTADKENAPQWRTLFVQAIANYLMFSGQAPAVPDRAEVARGEQWLEERGGTGSFAKQMLKSMNPYVVGRTARGMFGGQPEQEEEAGTGLSGIADSLAHESINEAEAKWLIDHIMEDGLLHENERALLAFIKEESPWVHPSLHPLFEQAGL